MAASKGKSLKRGDKVSWQSSQGTVKGEVVGKITGTAKVKGHVAKASKASPEYKVKSAKTGAAAIHKAGALKKTGKS